MTDRKLIASENETLKRQLAERSRMISQCEARYDAVFNSALSPITLCTVEGVVLDVNRSTLETTGSRIEDSVGKYVWETPWYASAPEEAAKIKAAIENGAGQVIHYETQVRLANGEMGAFDVIIRPVRAAMGGDVRFLVVEGRDLTSERAAEGRAARAERMEALGLLTGGIAHDFNNFLTVVIGALDMVHRRPERENRSTLIAAALDAAQKAEALNKQLLAFARRAPVAAQEVDVIAALRALEPLLKKAIGEAVEVRLSTPDEPHYVDMEAAQFEAAVLNLCINARDAMPSGGSIVIEARPATPGELAFADITGSGVTVSVTDTGVGIPPEILPRIFDPFFTTKGAGGGTGLGLSQVYGFTKQTGGGVDVRSTLGRGATFKLILPSAPVRVASGRQTAPPERPLAPRRVLLVEDDASVAGVTQAMLLEMGMTVVTAANGVEAQNALIADGFDLLITDVIMPGGMNGVQLATWARKHHPEMKVLLLSGWAADTTAAGPSDLPIIQKPFDLAALKKAIEALA